MLPLAMKRYCLSMVEDYGARTAAFTDGTTDPGGCSSEQNGGGEAVPQNGANNGGAGGTSHGYALPVGVVDAFTVSTTPKPNWKP